AGQILEDRLHGLLRDGHPWDAHPMVKLLTDSDTDTVYVTGSISITKTFHLHPPHLRTTDASHTRRSLELCTFDNDGLSREQIRSDVYFRPLSAFQATFDSFICDPEQETIYVFQFTVSAKHSVKCSGLVMLAKLCSDFKIVYIVFTPTKLPFGKQSEPLVVEKWHAIVSSDRLFAVSATFECLTCWLAYMYSIHSEMETNSANSIVINIIKHGIFLRSDDRQVLLRWA
ncbi:hypothetical protein BT96DRAFT_836004, partial [Gymnopus androsaceus JB14]